MNTTAPVNRLLATDVRHHPLSRDWTIRVAGSITDEQAKSIEWRAQPEQVKLGGFVEVIDTDGTRIGHVKTATYMERLAGPAYVTVTLELR
jgi:hypothetical protein